MMAKPYYYVVACEALRAPMARTARRIDAIEFKFVFLPQSLHMDAAALPLAILNAIDRVESFQKKPDYIVLGYGACGRALDGAKAKSVPLVVPRADDCRAFALGSNEKLRAYAASRPDAYWYTDMLMERAPLQQRAETERALKRAYGEENGAYLANALEGWSARYQRAIYVCDKKNGSSAFRARARQEAAERSWKFETVPGNDALIYKTLSGAWNDNEFLIVPPSQAIQKTADNRLFITAEE